MTPDIWQEYRECHPDGYQYSGFCEHYRAFARALPVTLRQSHAPGERLFVDYSGQTVTIIDVATGEERQAQIFVAVLGVSSCTYVEATWTQVLADWIGSHVRCLEYLGGAPELLVPDNLKSGVTHPCYYDPDINPSYQEFASHYGMAVLPARVRKPRDKAKAEAGVLLAQRWILARLRHQRFFSLAEVNAAIRPLLVALNAHPFKKLPGSRQSVFEEVDRPALRPLPLIRYEFAQWKVATVGIDYHLELDRHYYSVPYRYARQKVDVRYTATVVEVFQKGERIASHPRSPQKGRHTTLEAHLAPAHQAVAGWNAQRFLDWAATVGPQTQAAIAQVLAARVHPQQGYRTALGILRLGKTHGDDRLEAACLRAIQIKAVTYRSIASILKHALERQTPPRSRPTYPPTTPMCAAPSTDILISPPGVTAVRERRNPCKYWIFCSRRTLRLISACPCGRILGSVPFAVGRGGWDPAPGTPGSDAPLVTKRHPRAAPRRPVRAQQTVPASRAGGRGSSGPAEIPFPTAHLRRPSRRRYPMTSTSLFTVALGLQAPWKVAEVAFDPQTGRIDFGVGFAAGSRFVCPHCGAEHQPVHDTQEREWRHLNFFQYQAYIRAKVPRVRCEACGKTAQVPVPWAREGSGFTRLMEALIVTLAGAMTVRQVAQLLGVSDGRIWRTLDHYVDTARAQEDFSAVASVGLDETAARRGHHYISLFHDLDASRLLFACEGRKATVVDAFAEDLEAHGGCAENIRNVCIDMSASYRAGIAETLPWADVTFDEFHVIQLVNKAVDEVRRQEAKSTPELKRTRYLWLKDKHAWTERQIVQFADLRQLNLQTHRAFQIKEALREIFRTASSAAEAEPLLDGWYSWARRCRLEPMKQVAKTLKDHWTGILNAFDSKLTNGRVEAINSLIQAAKAKARGYGTVKHLITISYLVAGKLTHLPASPFNLKACASQAT